VVPVGAHAPGAVYFVDPFGFVFDIVERGTPGLLDAPPPPA
jgi:hypothetical protein